MNKGYSMVIRWSEADQLYLVSLPEFSEGVVMPCTHGATYAEAAAMGQDCLESLIDSYEVSGLPLPSPQVFDSEVLQVA
jgi:predicted RNase H-like HicB family nuclease